MPNSPGFRATWARYRNLPSKAPNAWRAHSLESEARSDGILAGFAATLTAGFLSDIVQQVVDAQDALDLQQIHRHIRRDAIRIGLCSQDNRRRPRQHRHGDQQAVQVNIGKDPEKYRQLGIDAKNGYEAFKQLADIFVAIEEPETRAAVAAEALGKAWAGSAAGLSEGGKGL